MNKIEKLISEICPNGVQYRTIKSSVLNIEKINWKEHSGKLYKYIDLTSVDRDTHQILETQDIQAESAPSRAQQIVRSGDILLGATRPMLKRFCIVSDEYNGEICSTGFCVLRADERYVLSRWLYHIISSNNFFCHVEKFQKGASYPAINDADVKAFSMPVPPLEVQHKIVRILDNFTERTAELKAGLTAELTARKKQYEYYRDTLVSKYITNKSVQLDSVCEIYDGVHQTPNYTSSGVPFVSVENIDNLYGTSKFISEEAYSKYKIKPQIGDVFMTRITAGEIGRCAVVNRNDDLAYYVSLALLRPNIDILDSKYLKYYIESGCGKKELNKRILWNATPTKINKDDIGKIRIYVPPLAIQRKLVNILDNFDSICTELNIALPAEIKARQKQYEYYRDKLLTFKELSE